MMIDGPPLRKRWYAYLPLCLVAAGAAALAPRTGITSRPVGASVRASGYASSYATVHASSKQLRAAGAAVFRDRGCQHCHGAEAKGTDRGPDLSGVGKKLRKDRIEQQIREGGNGMPAFGDVLPADEVQSLVDFLGAKRKTPPSANRPSTPQKPAANPASDDSGS